MTDNIENNQDAVNLDDQTNHVKGVIEAILFVNEKPVTLDQMKKVLDTISSGELKKVIKLLQDEYNDYKKGIEIKEIAGGYQMLSNSIYASYIRDFYKTKHKEKLSKPSLETLAIMAYKQPVTRADIEMVRGVNSDGVVGNLLDKELIKIVGKKDVPGRPYLYGTTKQFLEYFGLKSLENLPKLEEFPALQEKMDSGSVVQMDIEEGDVVDEVVASEEVVEDSPVVDEVVASEEVVEETPVVDEVVASEEVVEETPVIDEVVVSEVVVEETPVVDEVVVDVI